MAAPLIEAGDITESGNNTASSSWAVSYPNASAGDLLIFNLGWDDSTTTSSVTAPAGPNGEVLSSIAGPVASNSTEVRGQSWFTIATGTWTASTLTFTPSASEQWTAAVIKVPAGEFDPRDPMGAASTRASANTADTTVDSVGYAIGAADGGGTLVWFAIVDTVALGSLSSGWTSRVTRDRGAVAIGIATRNAATTASETTSSTDTWGISADSWASIAYVVRPPPALYYVVYPSAASEPSAAQVKAGQQQSGAAATAAGSETARTTTGEEVFAAAATGLTGGTSYKTSFVWSDGANDSAVHTTAAWTTAAIYNEDTTDSGALTDASAAMMLLVGSASDSGVLTDTASGQRVSGDAISDSGALTDTAAGGLALAASASDSGALTDAATGAVSAAEVVSDSVAGSDAAASTWVVGESVTDAADVTDQVTGVGIWLEAASDSAAATDAATAALTLAEAVSDPVAATDAATVGLVVAEVLSDSVEATDSAAGQAIYAEAVSDSADLSDTATGDSGLDASVVDSAEASESVSTSLIASDALADAAESSDGVVVTAVYQEVVSDSLSATESVVESVGGHSYFESVEDVLEASDSTLATLLSFGASVRSQGGGSGGGRLWTRDLDDEIEAEMGAILKGPPLTSEVIEEIAARLDSPPQTRIMEHRRPAKATYSPPVLDFQAVQAKKRRNRQRLLLLL